MKQAIVYIRIKDSGEVQNRIGLRIQEKQLREYCAKKGYRIVNVYTDICEGASCEREGLTQLLQDIKTKHTASDILVIKQHSTLSTVPVNLTQLIVLLHQSGLKVETSHPSSGIKRQLPLWHYVNLIYTKPNHH